MLWGMLFFNNLIHADTIDNYNLIWNSPSMDEHGSMPIGNGETGMNVWVEPNGDLVFYISRTDSWDENERLCKLGRVRISFDPALTPEDFKQELKLAQGEILIRSGKEGETLQARIWVDALRNVIHVDSEGDKKFKVKVGLELWRNEKQTFETMGLGISGFKGPKTIYPDTVISSLKDRIVWYHRNPVSPWQETLKLQGLESSIGEGVDPLLHRTFGAMIMGDGLVGSDDRHLISEKPQKKVHISIFTHTQTPATESEWLMALEENRLHAQKIPHKQALTEHRNWWMSFWDRSWIFATQTEPAVIPSLIPSNAHNIRLGTDQSLRSKFSGEIGRISLIKSALPREKIAELARDRSLAPNFEKENVLFSDIPHPYSEIADSAMMTNSPELTIEAWIRPVQHKGGQRIIDKTTPGSDVGLVLDTYPGNGLRLIMGSTGFSVPDCLSPDTWHHVAVAIDAGSKRVELYLDGKKIAGNEGTSESDAFTVTQAYILQRWVTACGGRGQFPIKFNGSIFTVQTAPPEKSSGPWSNELDSPDYRRWGGCYWFQNTRAMYWPMLASGDYDMMRPLFKMYLDALPLAMNRTKIYFDHPGAFFPETMSSWGTYENGFFGWGHRTTGKPGDPVANQFVRFHYSNTLELLAMMIDHYDHTGDQKFLRNELLPIADQFLLWWDAHWGRDDQGQLYMFPAYACETYWNVVNPLPDVAGLMWSLDRLLELSDDEISAERRVTWEKQRETIPPIPMRVIAGSPAISAAEGELPKAKNSENPELYAIYPFRLYGVGKEDLELARHTFINRRIKKATCWSQDDIQAAFLGLTETATEYVTQRASRKDPESRFPAFWAAHHDWNPDQDHGGNLLMALQTMILQSDDGKIHILPAWPKKWNLDFKLHASQQTTVEGKVRDGKLISVIVTPKSREKDLIVHVAKTL